MSEEKVASKQPTSKLQLESKVSAVFSHSGNPTDQEASSINALNKHAEDICEDLQPVFKTLIVQMLELKREHFATSGEGAR